MMSYFFDCPEIYRIIKMTTCCDDTSYNGPSKETNRGQLKLKGHDMTLINYINVISA